MHLFSTTVNKYCMLKWKNKIDWKVISNKKKKKINNK